MKKFKEIFSQVNSLKFSNFQEKMKKILLNSRKFEKDSSFEKNKSKTNDSNCLKKSHSKYDKTEISAEIRELKIINKLPPKNLLLKHRKLLEGAKTNNIYMVKTSGFIFYPNDMNVKDKKGNTALYYAAKHCNYDFCSYLVELGAKVNEACENGNTPFHICFSTNSIEVCN